MSILLEVDSLRGGYGRTRVLEGIGLQVAEGDRVCILGGNGSGKSTLLKIIVGLVRHWSGSIRFAGDDIGSLPAHQRFHRGMAYVPQDRKLFRQKTVGQNLELGCLSRNPSREQFQRTLEQVLDSLPVLQPWLNKSVAVLSGGEQQVVAIGRALMSEPKLLLLDEPSAGLSPVWLQSIGDTLLKVTDRYALTLVLVEQKVDFGLDLTERAYVIRNGVAELERPSAALRDDPDLVKSYLG